MLNAQEQAVDAGRMTTAEVLAFFQGLQRSEDDRVSAARDLAASVEEAQAQRAERIQSISDLESLRREKQDLREQAAREGLDVTALEPKLAEITSRLEGLQSELEHLDCMIATSKETAASVSSSSAQDYSAQISMATALHSEHPDGFVVEAANLLDGLRRVEVDFVQTLEDGTPEIAVATLGSVRILLRIGDAAGRFAKNTLPPSLRWLGLLDTEDAAGGPGVVALLVRNAPRLVPVKEVHAFLSTELELNPTRTSYGGAHDPLMKELGCRYELKVDLVEPEPEASDSEGEYQGWRESPHVYESTKDRKAREERERQRKREPLVKALRERLKDCTTTEPPFEPESPDVSDRLAERLRADIDAIRDCPWSAEIAGPLARLKHLLESGAKPKFWVGPVPSSFGFRLRTRDHDWLVGDLVIDPALDAPTGSEPIAVVQMEESYHSPMLARLGRLRLRVYASGW